MWCVSSADLSVLWNGEKVESFKPEQGLRQDDALSLYLFVLCLEVLSQRIHKFVELKQWKPITLSQASPSVSYLFFVDDIFLFGEASME